MSKTTWVDSVAQSIPEEYQYVSDLLQAAMSESSIKEIDRHAIALVAAICANNGELAFEICMNSPLFGTPERELAKHCATAACLVKVTHDSEPLYELEEKYNIDNVRLYILAASLTLDNKSIRDNYLNSEISAVRNICGPVSVLNKIVI